MIRTFMKNNRRNFLERRRNYLTIRFADRRTGADRRSEIDRRTDKPTERKKADERRKHHY